MRRFHEMDIEVWPELIFEQECLQSRSALDGLDMGGGRGSSKFERDRRDTSGGNYVERRGEGLVLRAAAIVEGAAVDRD